MFNRRAALTYSHTICTVIHMKTTLNISDATMQSLKSEAVRRGKTMSELVETALRGLLQTPARQARMPPLPRFRSGGARVNVANREALYDVMGG